MTQCSFGQLIASCMYCLYLLLLISLQKTSPVYIRVSTSTAGRYLVVYLTFFDILISKLTFCTLRRIGPIPHYLVIRNGIFLMVYYTVILKHYMMASTN